jgi:hypothetical protein
MVLKVPRGTQGGDIAIGRELINDCVRYAPALNIVYLNNPKCGCTTVKHALWLASDAALETNTFAGNAHDRRIDPFARNVFRLSPGQRERVADAAVFSVVRNPFARALSAYMDKVANDPGVWPFFVKRLGLKSTVGKKELSFADFLGLVAVAHDDVLDGHFRPQCRNLLLPLATPDFIGSVENMGSVGAFLETRGVPFRDERMNATRAQEHFVALFDARTAALVRERYAEDFAVFDYPANPGDVRSPPGRKLLYNKADAGDSLLACLSAGKMPPGAAREAGHYFAAFARSRDSAKRLRLIAAAFEQEHSWSRLRRYANYARRKGGKSRDLHDAIHGRMVSLRRRYARAVSNPDIFVEFA